MKIGRSNVFGFLVDASEVEHRDCEAFQIVCPECHEYLFKGVRVHRNTAIHYFSHYRADQAQVSLCEKRAAIRASQSGGDDSIEREQTLKHYLETFTSMVQSLPMFSDPDKMATTRSKIESSKSVRDMRRDLRSGMSMTPDMQAMMKEQAYGDPADPEDSVFGRWDSSQAYGWTPKTRFARSIQVRVAADMLKTLMTKPAIPAWNCLFASSWIMLLGRISTVNEDGPFREYRRYVGPVVAKACMGKDIDRDLDALRSMRCGAPYMRGPGSWLDKLEIELLSNIFEILLAIDYSQWSHARSLGQEPEAISAEMRAEAGRAYEEQKRVLEEAGVDTTQPSEQDTVDRITDELVRSGNVKVNMEHVLHRAMTGEGLAYRKGMTAPSDDEAVTAMSIIVRPNRGGMAPDGCRNALLTTFPGLKVEMSNYGCPNAEITRWNGTYARLRHLSENLSKNVDVAETTILFGTRHEFMALTTGQNGVFVEKIGGIAQEA